MKFRVIYQQPALNAQSPVRVVEQTTGREVGWINRYLDREYVRRLALRSLRIYAHNLLHFVRWWARMRIGECADLATDCLRCTGPNQWAIHVPLGKLKTERLVPVDSFVCKVVQRLRFFRSLEGSPEDGRLLPRPHRKEALVRQLRDYLHQVCHALGLSTRIVPHQFRHSYATEMLRAGIGFPVLMKLLGHRNPEMTMRYLDVALTDLQREFQLARSKPRHLTPQPKTPAHPIRPGIEGVIDSLQGAQHVLEMFRRTLPTGAMRACLDRLSNRLAKIRAEANKLQAR